MVEGILLVHFAFAFYVTAAPDVGHAWVAFNITLGGTLVRPGEKAESGQGFPLGWFGPGWKKAVFFFSTLWPSRHVACEAPLFEGWLSLETPVQFGISPDLIL